MNASLQTWQSLVGGLASGKLTKAPPKQRNLERVVNLLGRSTYKRVWKDAEIEQFIAAFPIASNKMLAEYFACSSDTICGLQRKHKLEKILPTGIPAHETYTRIINMYKKGANALQIINELFWRTKITLERVNAAIAHYEKYGDCAFVAGTETFQGLAKRELQR